MNILRKCCTAKVLKSFILLDKRTFSAISGVSNYTDVTDEVTGFIRYFHVSPIFNKRSAKKRKSETNERDITYFSVRKRKPVFEVWKNMTVADLGAAVGADSDFIFELMEFVDNTEKYTHPNQIIDNWNVICDIVSKLNGRLTVIAPPKDKPIHEKLKDVYRRPPPDESKLVKRPPVVTIMGHVDHGKTTLLDALRHTSVVSGEFGGITQHIGAFSVKVSKGEITFLDTPGHAAFSSMRNRGAHCTDIVVLVVAADDGVMEQTMESVRMANDAKVPLIVAINKIDKPDADIERTKKMLMANNILTEEFGGDIQCVCISALKNINLDSLIDAILTQAEVNNIRGDPTGLIEGVVIESKQDRYRGSLSTILVQRGTLKKGAVLVAGTSWAKVRGMFDAQQKTVSEAPPSTPVETIGWHDLPHPGDIIIEVEQERKAREVVEYRKKKKLEKKAIEKDLPEIKKKMEEHYREYKPLQEMKRRLGKIYLPNKLVVETKSTTEKEEEIDVSYSIIVKGDVEGSIEAILDVLVTYNNPLCKFDIIHYGVGNVSISDVDIADLFKGDIYTFNTGVLPEAKTVAEEKGIAIRPHNVIYRLVDEIKAEINKRLPAKVEEEIVGEAKVLQLFLIQEGKQKNLPVAGCAVLNGELKSNLNFKIIRNDKVIHTGPISSIRHLKQAVQVIKKGQECGIRFEDSSVLFEPGDIIQCFKYYNVPQEIKWNPF